MNKKGRGSDQMSEVEGHSLSVIVPALNEEANLPRALSTVIEAASECFDDFEIIVVDDGSTDRTAAVAESFARSNGHIRLISHDDIRGFGASYDTGRRNATKAFTVMVQGDGPFSAATLCEFFSHAGEADFICGYWNNAGERILTRRIISSVYTKVLNTYLGLNLKYYNGLQLYRTKFLNDLEIKSTGFGFQAEVIVAAISSGQDFVEVPTDYIERPEGGATKIFRARNILSVLGTLLQLHRYRRLSRALGRAMESSQ